MDWHVGISRCIYSRRVIPEPRRTSDAGFRRERIYGIFQTASVLRLPRLGLSESQRLLDMQM